MIGHLRDCRLVAVRQQYRIAGEVTRRLLASVGDNNNTKRRKKSQRGYQKNEPATQPIKFPTREPPKKTQNKKTREKGLRLDLPSLATPARGAYVHHCATLSAGTYPHARSEDTPLEAAVRRQDT